MSGRSRRKAEVQNLDLAVGGQHQVRRLDVAVDEAMLVDGLQADGRLPGQFGVGIGTSLGDCRLKPGGANLAKVKAV